MKYLIIFIVLAIVLSSCTNTENDEFNNTQSVKTNNSERYEQPRVILSEDETVYENKKAGYRLIFPENWRGHYVVTEYSPKEVCIGFYGKSKTGQIAYKDNLGRYGLDMAWIVDELPDENEGSLVISKLGEVNGKDYYLTSPRGGNYLADLAAIADLNSTTRKLAKYIVDMTELELAAQDLKEAIQMRDDLYNMRVVFELL